MAQDEAKRLSGNELRKRLLAELEPLTPLTAGEQVRRFGESVAGGALGATGAILRSPSTLLEQLTQTPITPGVRIGQGEMMRLAGTGLEAKAEELIQQSELAGRGNFLTEDIAQGLGSMAPFVAAGVATAPMGGTGAFLATIPTAAALEFQAAFDEAKMAGQSDADAFQEAAVRGALAGPLEAIPIGRVFARANKATGGAVEQALRQGVMGALEEGAQETIQDTAMQAIASEFRDEDLMDLQEALRSGRAGAGAGGILGTIMGALTGVRTRGRRAAPPGAPEPLTPSVEEEADTLEAPAEAVQDAVADVATLNPDLAREVDRAAELGTPRPLVAADETSQDKADLASHATQVLHTPQKVTDEVVTQEDLDKAVESQEGGQQLLFSGLMPLLKSPRLTMKGAKNWIVRNFKPGGAMGTEFFEDKLAFDAWYRAQMQQVAFTAKDFETAIRSEYGVQPDRLSDAQADLIDQALKGARVADPTAQDPAQTIAAIELLPAAVAEHVTEMRNHIDELSQRMIDDGVAQGDLALRLAENRGVYATRTFEVFSAKKDYWEKIPDDIKNKAVALIRKEYPDLSDADARAKVKAIIVDANQETNPMRWIASGGLGRDLSIFKQRKDIPDEIRALLGERRDALTNYGISVARMGRLIASHNFLNKLGQDGMGRVFFDKPTGEFTTRIAAEGSNALAPLNGLHTTKEFAQALADQFETLSEGAFMRLMLRINSLVKQNKTVFSLMTHARNLHGNVGFAIANNHWRVGKGAAAFRGIMTKLAKLKGKERRDYVLRATELGLLGEEVGFREVQDNIRDAHQRGWDTQELLEAGVRKGFRRTLSKFGDLYAAEDGVWKLYAWENEKARYRKAYPNMPESQLEEMTAKIVTNTYPTYSKIPRGPRRLRRNVLFGTFVSFPSEVIRVGGNTIAQAVKEVRSPNPKVRKIGYQRLAGVMTASVGLSSLAAATRWMFGITADDDEDARHFFPPWSKSSQVLWGPRDEDGNRRWIDASYSDPYSYLRDPIRALFRGGDWKESVINAGMEAFEPFYTMELGTSNFLQLGFNKDEMGRPIYNPAESFNDIAQDIFDHARNLEPGTISQMERVLDANMNPQTFRDPTTEAVAMMTGVRFNTLDPDRSLGFIARDFKDSNGRITSALSSFSQARGNLRFSGIMEEEDLRAEYDRTERERREQFRKMHESAHAAIALGETREDVFKALTNNLPQDTARRVLSGNYRPYSPSRNFMNSAIRNADPEFRQELVRRRALLQSFAADPATPRGPRVVNTSEFNLSQD